MPTNSSMSIDCIQSWECHMATEENPFEAVRAMMLENLEKVGTATQSYLDIVERTMRAFPGANQEQISTFKECIERQVAANRDLRGEAFAREGFSGGLPHSGRI